MKFEGYNHQHHPEITPPLDLLAKKLHDHVSTETKKTQTILTEYGIRDLPAFITFDTTFDTPTHPFVEAPIVVEEETYQESRVSTPDLVEKTHTEPPRESVENEGGLYIFTATSQQQLIDEIRNYYIKNALKATEKTLAQRKISKARIPQMAQQIITGIAQKKVDAFYNVQMQLLIKQSFSEKDAQDYCAWRINNVDEAVSFSLKTDAEHAHALSTTNFTDDHFISRFLQERSATNDMPSEISLSAQEPSFHTSAHIDAMLDELQNL